MYIYMLCDKKHNGLMSMDFVGINWISSTSNNNNLIYMAQDEDATNCRRGQSIHATIKNLARAILNHVKGNAFAVPILNPITAPRFYDMINDINGQLRNFNLQTFTFFDNLPDDIQNLFYKVIIDHIEVKRMNVFTGQIDYESVVPYLSQKIQRGLR